MCVVFVALASFALCLHLVLTNFFANFKDIMKIAFTFKNELRRRRFAR